MGHRKTAIAVLLAAVAVTLVCVFDRDVLHFLGWDGQTSDYYAAWSGSVPAFISAACSVALYFWCASCAVGIKLLQFQSVGNRAGSQDSLRRPTLDVLNKTPPESSSGSST